MTELRSCEYNKQHVSRGRAVIIANIDYYDRDERRPRKGSMTDSTELERIFQSLEFVPIRHSGEGDPKFIHENKNKDGIKQLMKDGIKNIDRHEIQFLLP